MGIINTNLVNADIINGPEIVNISIGSGNIISLIQNVGIPGLGNVIPIAQDVQVRETGSGNVIIVSQSVTALGSGNIIQLSQNVQSPEQAKLDQFGWTVSSLIIDGVAIDNERITDTIEWNATEDGSPQLNITIKLIAGVIDLTEFQGKDISLNVITTDYGEHRLFTGKIDIPEINMIWDIVTLRCSTNRNDLINQQDQSFVDSIGLYSSNIFSDAPNKSDQVLQRLETVPQSVEVTNYGNVVLVNWEAKSTADYTFEAEDILRDTPKPNFRVGSSARIINKVNIDFDYRYDNNYQMQRTFQWTWEPSVCEFLVMGYDMCKREMIQSAAESAGWPIKGAINFGDIYPSGVYRCGASLTPVIWSTTSAVQSTTTGSVDSEGSPVLDSNGNQINISIAQKVVDYADIYAGSASWIGTTRWAQTVNEKYSLTVQSPESITQYGTKSKQETHGIQSTFDSSTWEDYTAYSDPGFDISSFISRDDNIADFNNAVTVALNRARTTILKSHRDSRVEFELCHFFPAVQVFHTVATNASLDDDDAVGLVSQGKVFSISHKLNVKTGQSNTSIKTTISSIATEGSDSVLSIPTRPSYAPTIPGGSVFLRNHFGEDPSTDAAQSWNGFIGNKFLGVFGDNIGESKTEFPISFVVDTPPVEASLRNLVNVTSVQSYNVAVPKDIATITVDEKV